MRDLLILLARLMGPGGLRSVVAESLLVKQQLLILNRSRHRDCVFRFRRGPDGRSIPPIRIPGEQARDSMLLVTKAADVKAWNGYRITMMFIDGTGIGGPIVDRLHQLGFSNQVTWPME